MKKIIITLLLLTAGFGIWKYLTNKSQSSSSADGEPSMIKETKATLEQTANYVPNAIDRKDAMENKINDSVVKENERLQKAMDEIK